jgi:cation:H+ antiporter
MELMFLILGGLIALTVGGELLVRGASALASALGVSPLVIGLTVVAFGTSSPELMVTLQASLSGSPDLAVANVVGSNIFNVLFILGACALMAPLLVSSQLVRIDVPILIASSFLLLACASGGRISSLEGGAFVALAAVYTVFLIRKSRTESKLVQEEFARLLPPRHSLARHAGFVLAGLALLALGGGWLVRGAVALAAFFGVSDTVIGLTIVAAGTSLPEVATSLLATLRGQREIAIGNVVGSGIYNILLILGLGALVAPTGLPINPEVLRLDIPIMIGAAVACLPVFLSGFQISRWEGGLFLAVYGLYSAHLLLHATRHELLGSFQQGLIYFAAPALALSLAVILFQALRRR